MKVKKATPTKAMEISSIRDKGYKTGLRWRWTTDA